jgi:hypothetical protein
MKVGTHHVIPSSATDNHSSQVVALPQSGPSKTHCLIGHVVVSHDTFMNVCAHPSTFSR